MFFCSVAVRLEATSLCYRSLGSTDDVRILEVNTLYVKAAFPANASLAFESHHLSDSLIDAC